jgi:hypothetical protein
MPLASEESSDDFTSLISRRSVQLAATWSDSETSATNVDGRIEAILANSTSSA